MKKRLAPRLFTDLADLAKRAPHFFPGLARAISSVPAQLYPFADVTKAIESFCKSLPNDQEDVGELVGELSSSVNALLYTLASSSKQPREMRSEAVEVIQESHPTESGALISLVDSILQCKDLLAAFKATALNEDNDNILIDSKVIVDIRPVFDLDDGKELTCSTILHRLKLTYRKSTNVEHLIFTLGAKELDELAQVVRRAQFKNDVLKKQLPGTVLGKIMENGE